MIHNRATCGDGCGGWIVQWHSGQLLEFPCQCVCHRPHLSENGVQNSPETRAETQNEPKTGYNG